MSAMRFLIGTLLVMVLLGLAVGANAQAAKATEKEVAAIRACAEKYKDDLDKVERQCLFNLVATPCTNKPSRASNNATADCYRTETAIWDDLLNENFKKLLGTLDDGQADKLRAMQRAWIAYRDADVALYQHVFGSKQGQDRLRSALLVRLESRRAKECAPPSLAP